MTADLIDLLDRGYAQLDEPRETRPKVIRASSLGDQPRKLVLAALAPDRKERPTGRALRTFEVGKQRHDALRAALVQGLGGNAERIPVRADDEEELVEDMHTPGWRIVGHPDGVITDAVTVGGNLVRTPALLEIKTVNALGWTRAKNGEVDPKYLVQSGWYARAVRALSRVFLFEKKDTQHVHATLLPAAEPLLSLIHI